jgi:hypothetical protein
MRLRTVRGTRWVLAIDLCALAAGIAPAARGQVAPPPPTLEASSRIAGAVPPQIMDTGTIPATVGTQAAVNDSFSGPIQVGGLAIGSGMASVSASSSEGTIKLFSQTSDTGALATVAILTNLEAKAFDSVQITQLPGGQGQLSALYFPTMLGAGGPITGSGNSWSATIRLTATIEDFASDGSLRGSFTLAADATNGNNGPGSHDTGPVAIPVQLNDTLTIDVDETLQTSASAAPTATSTVTADFSGGNRIYLVPLSSGLAFTSASGHSYLPLAGDTNVDGKVDFSDLLTLAQNYGATGATWEKGDFNADGTVDFGDLLALAQDYGQSVDGSPAVALGRNAIADMEHDSVPVPEASAAALLAAGSFRLLYRGRRA